MFDIGWTEMMVLAVIAVVVVGPKDLPKIIRTVGKWVGKARSMAREFQSSLDDIAKEAELDDIKKQIDKAGADFEKAAQDTAEQADFGRELEHTVDPSGTLDKVFDTSDPAVDSSTDLPDGEETASGKPVTVQDPYAAPAAPAHSLSPEDDAEQDEPVAANSRTGT